MNKIIQGFCRPLRTKFDEDTVLFLEHLKHRWYASFDLTVNSEYIVLTHLVR